MKLAVVGSRNFNDYGMMVYYVDMFNFQWKEITEIISGGAKGADSLAEKYASERNIPIKVFKPEWDKYGKSAGFKRNIKIIDECDALIAFWDGKSKGTKHSIDLAKKQHKKVIIYYFNRG